MFFVYVKSITLNFTFKKKFSILFEIIHTFHPFSLLYALHQVTLSPIYHFLIDRNFGSLHFCYYKDYGNLNFYQCMNINKLPRILVSN